MKLHLPLNAVDRVNRPPVFYLTVQDGLILTSSFLWTISYLLYVRQAFRDRNYGMPLVPLWANFAWEFLFTLVCPTSVAQVVAFGPWLVIDLFIIYTTLQFGPEQWRHAPMVAENMGTIMAVGILFMMAVFWAVIKTIGSEKSSFYIAYGVQILISAYSIAHLVKRGHTAGHSWGIWFFRTTGTGATILQFLWKYWHYPANYRRISEPLTMFLFAACVSIDLIYPFVYAAVEQKEMMKMKYM
jgi:paspaline synthase